MELSSLRYFQAMVDCGSLTAAARKLRVSQPTLTVVLRKLEQELETTLLVRHRHGVRATSTGVELRRYAGEVLALLDHARQRIRGLETDDCGSFVIGCHESLGAYFLPGFFAEWASTRIEISLWSGSSANVRDAVVDGTVHFGIVVNPRPHPDLVIVDLFRDAVDFFVLRRDDELAPGFEEAQARLKAGPLIFAGRVAQCQQLIDRSAAAALLPRQLLSCGDLELVKSLARAGIGVALLPRRVAAYGVAESDGRRSTTGLQRLHPDLPSFPDVISLLYHSDLHRTRASLRLKDALVEHGRRLDRAAPPDQRLEASSDGRAQALPPLVVAPPRRRGRAARGETGGKI